MFNDIGWTKKGNSEMCISNSEQVTNNAKRFPSGHYWSFHGREDEENGMERTPANLKEKGTPSLKKLVEHFKETGHPAFRGSNALNRGILKRKRWKMYY